MNRLEAGITETMNRMNAAEVQIAKQAKREEWPVICRGVYPANRKAYVRVAVPATWRKCEAWRNTETIDVPADAYDSI